MRNTKKMGKFTLFVYQEKPNYYIGVCLEFDLIQEGKNPVDTMRLIRGAGWAYLKTVIKKNYSDDLLNQPAPDEYWKKYRSFLKKRAETVKKIEEEIKSEKRAQTNLIRWDDFVRNSSSAQDVSYDARSRRELINA